MAIRTDVFIVAESLSPTPVFFSGSRYPYFSSIGDKAKCNL